MGCVQHLLTIILVVVLQQSSIQLIGELLFRITGISGKAEIEEEEGAETGGVDSTRKVLLDVLGQEKRDRVLSTLYVVRQDAVNAVRTGSIHIWKALVQSKRSAPLIKLSGAPADTAFGSPISDTPRTREISFSPGHAEMRPRTDCCSLLSP